MQIGQLSKITGFSKDTIRWYEKIGLLDSLKKERYENNYRKYGPDSVKRLKQIKLVKSYGFSINDIKEFLLLGKHDFLSCNSASSIFQNRLDKIEVQIQVLQENKIRLLALKERCEGNCTTPFET